MDEAKEYILKALDIDPNLDFSSNFTVPKPRHERIITKRGVMGRIIHLKPPQL